MRVRDCNDSYRREIEKILLKSAGNKDSWTFKILGLAVVNKFGLLWY